MGTTNNCLKVKPPMPKCKYELKNNVGSSTTNNAIKGTKPGTNATPQPEAKPSNEKVITQGPGKNDSPPA